MASGRSKKKLKNRPKFKVTRSLRGRKIRAKKSASHKRSLGRSRKRRKARGSNARK